MHAMTQSLEDYLEAIYILVKEKKVACVRDVAKTLNVKMPSVVKAIGARDAGAVFRDRADREGAAGGEFGAEPPYAAQVVPDEARRQPEDGGQGRVHDGAHPVGRDDGQDSDVYGKARLNSKGE